MARGLVVVACLLGACSPYGNGAYSCTTNAQCGPGAVCEPNSTCAFPDTTCPSGYRYGQYSQPSNECVTGSSGDGGVDTPIDSPPGEFCYGDDIVKPCFAQAPTGARTITSDLTINTDDTTMCMAPLNSSAWCVIAADTIDLTAGVTVKARGSRPLVLVATQSITIAGTIDVSSGRGDPPGAGANGPACMNSTMPTGGGGGAGGSFGGKGGDAGNQTAAASGGGTAAGIVTVTTLQGGCKGQSGNGIAAGAGGNGGGAVYLIGAKSIFVSGTINASGEGADGATSGSSGGGGGGSGGFIGLDSPSVQANGSALIFANGGGGGQGSGSTTAGSPGSDPTSPSTPAPGGSAGPTVYGGAGGNGAAGIMLMGVAGSNGNAGGIGGGGGGGGGGGIVKVVPANQPLGGLVSPPQT